MAADHEIRVGEIDEALVRGFLVWNEGHFVGNHRMARQLASMRKLSDLPAVRARAAQVMDALGAGSL